MASNTLLFPAISPEDCVRELEDCFRARLDIVRQSRKAPPFFDPVARFRELEEEAAAKERQQLHDRETAQLLRRFESSYGVVPNPSLIPTRPPRQMLMDRILAGASTLAERAFPISARRFVGAAALTLALSHVTVAAPQALMPSLPAYKPSGQPGTLYRH